MKMALVAFFLLASGCGGEANVTPQPSASPAAHSPTPADYGPPPTRVPLIWVGDPNQGTWLIGFDWTGKPRGTIKLSDQFEPSGALYQSPDGSGFVRSISGKGGFDQFLDALGNPIPNQDTTVHYHDRIWADDSRHVCTLDYNDREWHIGLTVPGSPTTLHPVALDPSVVQSGIIAIGFRSCSPKNDRAVLVYNYQGRPTDVYVVRISDGTIVFHQIHPANTLGDITASPDGAMLAESSIKSTGYLMGTPAPSTIIRRVSDGSVVLSLDPSVGIITFNRDDTTALINTTPWAADVPTKLALVSLQSGQILWRSDGKEEYGGSIVHPTGAGFAVLLKVPSDTTIHPVVYLLILNADGTTTPVPGRYIRP